MPTRRPESLRRIWEVNYLGTFLGIQTVADPMAEAGGGGIVNISSIAGMQGIPHHSAYGGTKWAVRGLTKVAAIELGPERNQGELHPSRPDRDRHAVG